MIERVAFAALAPQVRADLIYEQARAEANESLWQAVMTDINPPEPQGERRPLTGEAGLRSLLVLLGGDLNPRPPLAAATRPPDTVTPEGDAGSRRDRQPRRWDSSANIGYAETIDAAASRTGLPASVLTAIIHAEAATDAGGRWQTMSRNPHSSAAGLGQFLTGTWISETERRGTWLHAAAEARGWLDAGGRLLASARSPLLALRYDGTAAIQAIADYAAHNLATLQDAGVAMNLSTPDLARGAYLGHHLGARDAIRFLRGQMDPSRARLLLSAQIGSVAAERRIAASGDPVAAHRAWLTSYIDRAVRTIS
ncbi:hypothetical protein [Sphingomonas sp. RIT328]|uniref:hypothetical protein n=1 Tax=Sphingomonas sp. RIT328 TaxID=1470591 RepID=UPI000451B72F|nr:hypothetical protein [Sphingomonas sp. RIT328]EZP48689.1 Peptidoglycan-binding protein [Sphingomonas sp. RIT328]